MRFRSIILLIATFLALLTFPSSAVSIQCPNPNETELSYRGDGTGLPDVYKKLVHCPNITSLDLDMTFTGCLINGEPWHICFQDGQRLPNLTKLSLSRYDLAGSDTGYIMPSWSWEYWFKTKAVGILRSTKLLPSIVTAWDETNLEKWSRVMDFSRLEELYLSQQDDTFYDRMQHELLNLQRLSLQWHATSNKCAPQNRIDFVRNMPSLRELKIAIGSPYIYYEPDAKYRPQGQEEHRMNFPLREILNRHCPSLQSLSLTQSESSIPSKRRPMLSLEDIGAIRDSCPSLTALELDIDRNATTGWPLQTLTTLTDIESLTSLNLRLELGADLHRNDEMGELDWNPEGITRGGPFREPTMNATAAEALFAFLRERKKGQSLVNVTFEVGDYIEKPYTGPIASGTWASGRARMFVCAAGEGERVGRTTKFGNCEIVGDVDPFLWDPDEVADPAEVKAMWEERDDAAVEAYLTRLRADDAQSGESQ